MAERAEKAEKTENTEPVVERRGDSALSAPSALSVLLIVNPAAGRGRARRLAARAARALAAGGHDVSVQETSQPGHARDLAAEASRSGAARVVAVGGDGTIGECAGGLAGSEVPLGILPAGRGNDLARALGIPRDLERALGVCRDGIERRIDLGRVNGWPFCTVAGIGFDAFVAERVHAGPWRRLGGLGYAAGVLTHAFTWPAAAMRIEGDFGASEGPHLLVAASNTGHYGGGVLIAPDARPDDAMLDCCLVRDMPRLRLLRLFPTAFRGRHLRFPEVQIVRTRRLQVEADRQIPIVADGEVAGTTPATVEIMPGAIRVMVPRPAG